MRFIHAVAVVASVALASFNAGCSAESESSDGSSEDALKATFTDPGKDLGRATTVVADVSGDAAFVVFDRGLERRAADGTVQALGKVDIGLEHFVVSKTLAAYVTASFVKGGGSKVVVHVLDRASGWKEVRTEDLSTKAASFRHPLAVIGDDTFAVGSGDEIVVLAKTGTKSSVKVAATPFSIYPSGAASHFYTGLDNGQVFDVDTKTKALTLQPKREGKDTALDILFDTKTKTWVTTDFEGIKIYGTDGKLLREVDLETKKGRFISSAALQPDGKLLVAHQTESSQERSVLATYDLKSLTRKELGTFDGIIQQLGPARDRLFFGFSPKGAAGFNSRVWYAHALEL
jgi:hypothetical protein